MFSIFLGAETQRPVTRYLWLMMMLLLLLLLPPLRAGWAELRVELTSRWNEMMMMRVTLRLDQLMRRINST